MANSDELRARIDKADDKYGPPASAHESYGVLAEEMRELLDAIHANKYESIRMEALDIAAAALRLADVIEVRDPAFFIRSGFC